jgi:hypothetical protein
MVSQFRRILPCLFFGWLFSVVAFVLPVTAVENPTTGSGSPADRTIDPPTAGAKAQSEGMSITQMRQLTSEFLQHQAEAQRDHLPTASDQVLKLCNWFVILRDDDRYLTSPLLRSTAAQVRVRLLKVAKDRSRQLRYENVPRPEAAVAKIDAQIESQLKSQIKLQIKRPQTKSSDEAASSVTKLSKNEPADSLQAAAAGPELDTGWQLVELIDRIVHPDFWESHGGPGTLHYYAARRVLVVRATSDVHQDLKDLLAALR